MKKLIVAISLLLVLTACGNNESKTDVTNEIPKEVKVEVKTQPEQITPNTSTEIQAIVTQDGKTIDDAEVKFEIWKEGSEKHDMIDATYKKDMYKIDQIFSETGMYNIVAHTNAKDMHVMPKVQVQVGTTEETKQGHVHEHGASDVSIHFMADKLVAGQSADIKAHIMQKNVALTAANVQFEIWQEGHEKREYVRATESVKGEYVAAPVFKTAGIYIVKVHVEKGDIHEHTEQKVQVQ
ncbi:FixH family protein [Ectobacillus antri]|uniref:FixH family protein n=1 Tax=Ectobacillus antri TaxID=2486280 RepID=A0ABT6H3R1_9BACI|nr:FixH family protein [Ectobacillus antri]MDG4655685.1 FixH family protein [Ectobacillus antri]MDG5753443.1 FixH family protein [Ectobacillus antri]